MFFFFQAEDGIRALIVTGVQTCALPIWPRVDLGHVAHDPEVRELRDQQARLVGQVLGGDEVLRLGRIGRAACRGRVEISGVAGSLKKKKATTIKATSDRQSVLEGKKLRF